MNKNNILTALMLLSMIESASAELVNNNATETVQLVGVYDSSTEAEQILNSAKFMNPYSAYEKDKGSFVIKSKGKSVFLEISDDFYINSSSNFALAITFKNSPLIKIATLVSNHGRQIYKLPLLDSTAVAFIDLVTIYNIESGFQRLSAKINQPRTPSPWLSSPPQEPENKSGSGGGHPGI